MKFPEKTLAKMEGYWGDYYNETKIDAWREALRGRIEERRKNMNEIWKEHSDDPFYDELLEDWLS